MNDDLLIRQALLDAAPIADVAGRNRHRASLKGEIRASAAVGCALADRCPRATEACRRGQMSLLPVPGRENYQAACILAREKEGA